jgi:hypothetical protein
MRSNVAGFFLVVFILIMACHKSVDHYQDICTNATVTGQARSCDGWAIVINTDTFTTAQIPAAFKIEGLKVCTEYSLYVDLSTCPCCYGGLKARIINMRKL